MANDFYTGARALTPSDTANHDGTTFSAAAATKAIPADAIYVGGAGVVALVLENGTVVNFTAVAGEIIPVRSIRINSTGTTATLLVALYQ